MLMEGYFLMEYFLSSTFLNKVSCIVDELSLLLSRSPTYSYLLLIQKYQANSPRREVLVYNATTTIEFQDSSRFVKAYHERMYDEDERLLDVRYI